MSKHVYLVTGAAGFIGFSLTRKLLDLGHTVIGLDNLNSYYDVQLKLDRLSVLGVDASELPLGYSVSSSTYDRFRFYKADLVDYDVLRSIFENESVTHVCNLAAQAGVRYSLENPRAYTDSNVAGFMNILECARHFNVQNLVYASTSSVYGLNTKYPLSEKDSTEHPLTLYAATKKANEMMAHSYSHLFGLPTTGLRFFTVYGPWGRPDMALFLFTKAILNDEPIRVFNYGEMVRDFTYIDDIVQGIIICLENPSQADPNWGTSDRPDPSRSSAPYRIFNIGNSKPVKIDTYISEIEKALGKKAIRDLVAMHPGDVPYTNADITELRNLGYDPSTDVEVGVKNFVEWYQSYFSGK